MTRLTVRDLSVAGKRVFVRVDFNVPIRDGQVTDDSRIRAALPTIRFIVEHGGAVVAASHLGRPSGNGFESDLSMEPVAKRLSELLEQPVKLAADVCGPDVEGLTNTLKPGEILLLENLRFNRGEKKGDPAFAEDLRKLSDLYVNDAFGTSHRSDTSVCGLPKLYDQAAAGMLMEKEIHYFEDVLADPERPYVSIVGGAKVSDKIPLLKHLIGDVDTILIGGAMAYTFLLGEGTAVGKSLVEPDLVDLANELRKEAAEKGTTILLPADHVVADDFSEPKDIRITEGEAIPEGFMGLDIGPETIVRYNEVLRSARTIVWNGPMGVFEDERFAVGTLSISEAMAEAGAVTIVGGGDSTAAVKLAGVADAMDHVSTGGGASLAYLAGEPMPGIDALSRK